MKVKSIANAIPQYFWPALSDNWSWKPIFGLPFEWPLKTGFTVSLWLHSSKVVIQSTDIIIIMINPCPAEPEHNLI